MVRLWKVVAAGVLAAGLALPVAAQQSASANAAPASASAQQGGHYDAQIQQEVNSELKKHDWAKDVRASVEDGIVNLQGTVPMYMDKVRLYQKIHNKDHVEGVRNQVMVAGPAVSDNELKQKLADKLAYNRYGYGLVFDNLTLGVNHGVVTVGGQVHDPVNAQSAIAEVENTPGVRNVIDDIKVLPVSPYDDQVRLEVARAIYGSSELSRYAMVPIRPIRIVVDNGHVTLYGVVDSKADKEIADIKARSVPNVFSVTDKLQVGNAEQAANKMPK